MKTTRLLGVLALGIVCLAPISKTNLAEINIDNENVIKLSEEKTNVFEAFTLENEIAEGEFTDALNVRIASYNKTNKTHSFEVRIGISDNYPTENYYIGYYENNNSIPAYLSFEYENKSGEVKEGKAEIIKGSNYGVGDSMGSTSIVAQADVELPFDSTIDISTVTLCNAFKVTLIKEDGVTVGREVDLENPKKAATTKLNTYKQNELFDFIDTSFNSFSEYGGFTAVNFTVTNIGTELYPTLSSTIKKIYEDNLELIENGTIYVRSRFSFGGDTKFLLTTTDNEQIVYSSIAASVNVSKNENSVVFLIEGLDSEKVKSFEIFSCSYVIELFNTTTSKVVPRSAYSSRYGLVDFKMDDILNSDGSVAIAKNESVDVISINTILISILISYIVLFLVADIIYFIVLKKKDEKSEFKVLRIGEFVKMSILSLICIGSILFDFLYILFRSTLFNNSIAVYNPLDWVICVLSVIVICLGGYFIKYFYVSIKNKNEKKRRDKLNLNADAMDDGLGIIKIKK